MRKYDHNEFDKLTDSKKQDVFEKIEQVGGQYIITSDLIQAFRNKDEFPHPSKLYPERVKSIWRYYATFGFIREQHEKYLTDMRYTVSYGISFMYTVTCLCGHTQYDYSDELQDPDDHNMHEDEVEEFIEWLDGFYISDYGFPTLNTLQAELWASDDLVHILITIDRIMNVWHGSGALADRFIHGGTQSLNELAFSTDQAA